MDDANNPLRYRHAYRRFLPHIQPPGAMLFVTFRLFGSLPKAVVLRLRQEAEQNEAAILQKIQKGEEQEVALYRERKRHFGRMDDYLDRVETGPRWLGEEAVALMVAGALYERDGRVNALEAFCIMPNHVHVVFTPLEREDGTYHGLAKVMHSLKRFTAGQGNGILGRSGAFWQPESYDHVVRDEAERRRIVRYVLNNPVKAGLVDEWERWRWSYVKGGAL
jgi:REP element-mobilizing transposase RayT